MYISTKTPEDQIAFDGMICDTVKKVIILGGFGTLYMDDWAQGVLETSGGVQSLGCKTRIMSDIQ